MDTKTQQLENGKIYRVSSRRKGTFTGKLLRHSSHSHQDRVKLTHAVFSRGHSVNKQLTKTFRRRS